MTSWRPTLPSAADGDEVSNKTCLGNWGGCCVSLVGLQWYLQTLCSGMAAPPCNKALSEWKQYLRSANSQAMGLSVTENQRTSTVNANLASHFLKFYDTHPEKSETKFKCTSCRRWIHSLLKSLPCKSERWLGRSGSQDLGENTGKPWIPLRVLNLSTLRTVLARGSSPLSCVTE